VLRWAMENGCPVLQECTEAASGKGNLEMLKLLHEAGCCKFDESTLSLWAVKSGKLTVVRWLRERGCPWNEQTTWAAAQKGNLAILVWLREQGCPWDDRVCMSAIAGGRDDVLRWAIENGCPLSNRFCEMAALKGYLEILMTARDRGCSFNGVQICASAASGGRLEVLRWLREVAGCAWNKNTTHQAALGGGNREHVLRYAIENGCPCDESVCIFVAGAGNIELLKWLREKGCPWDQSGIEAQASKEGQLELLGWVLQFADK